jgi:hypothetical protein
MKHHPFVSGLVLILALLILYKMSTFKFQTMDNVMFAYFIYLQIIALGFDHLYEVFDDFCF